MDGEVFVDPVVDALAASTQRDQESPFRGQRSPEPVNRIAMATTRACALKPPCAWPKVKPSPFTLVGIPSGAHLPKFAT